MRKFIPKINYSIIKKSNLFVFEIRLDCKIPVWGEILKKYQPWLEIPLIILKVYLDHLPFVFLVT